MNNNDVLLETKGISKRFGGIQALYRIDIKVLRNKILAIVGDNGAGKSTLVKIISGVILPDEGEIYFDGKKVNITDPIKAIQLGIEMVYQDLALCDNLDVTSNFFLGRELTKSYFKGLLRILEKRRMDKNTRALLDKLGIHIKSLRQPVITLSGGQRQGIAVGRAASWGNRLIILDEPTAALGVKEANKTLKVIKKLKDTELTVIVISHNLQHVFLIADYIMVLRQGRRVWEQEVAHTNTDEVVKMITGAEFGTI